MRHYLGIVIIIVALLVMWRGQAEFPRWADPHQPASVHVSPRYIEKALEETGVPNMVTAVLADYRGFDTLLETAVVFTAGIAVLMLLRRT